MIWGSSTQKPELCEVWHTFHVLDNLLLDEMQLLDLTELEALIRALHKTVQRQLPLTLVGAGLP